MPVYASPRSRPMSTAYTIPHAIYVLECTPCILTTWLPGLGPHWTRCDYGPDTFTPYDVIGHLIHGEKIDWLVRARIILDHGPSRPFDKYDRYAQFEDSR